jgi:hypothetical protein
MGNSCFSRELITIQRPLKILDLSGYPGSFKQVITIKHSDSGGIIASVFQAS